MVVLAYSLLFSVLQWLEVGLVTIAAVITLTVLLKFKDLRHLERHLPKNIIGCVILMVGAGIIILVTAVSTYIVIASIWGYVSRPA